MDNSAKEEFYLVNEFSPKDWYSERVDDEDGKIHYEAHGAKGSFVIFEGSNAKVDCEMFMRATRQSELELAAGALDAIHELLDSGNIPRGAFADDQVRNLVAMYNQRGDKIAELEKLNQELVEATQWKTMETAPKDGTKCLVVDMGVVSEAYCNDYGQWFLAQTSSTDYVDGQLYQCTHWMPLPKPPKT